ncbi:MAG: molybdopterin-biosynthesis enzyme MoeA-like protein [Candidatus Deianiraeaceae bacterium]|jgi:molybdopterin-biosynthesis enzyme MoeA-like protein
MYNNHFAINDIAVLFIDNCHLLGITHKKQVDVLARAIGSKGRYISEVRYIGNVFAKIAKNLKELSKKYNIVIVCGGVGMFHNYMPQAFANTFDCVLEENPKAMKYFQEFLRKNELVYDDSYKQTVMLPTNSRVLLNEVTGSFGFQYANVFTIPNDNAFKILCEKIATILCDGHKKYMYSVPLSKNVLHFYSEIAKAGEFFSDVTIDITAYEIILVSENLEQLEWCQDVVKKIIS